MDLEYWLLLSWYVLGVVSCFVIAVDAMRIDLFGAIVFALLWPVIIPLMAPGLIMKFLA